MERLIVLGTGNAQAIHCYNTCYAMQKGEEYFLVDAGGGNGILSQLDKAGIPLESIHNIFVTHAHNDHILGMVWMIRMIATSMNKGTYDGTLTIYCHEELVHTIKTLTKLTVGKKFYIHFLRRRIEISSSACFNASEIFEQKFSSPTSSTKPDFFITFIGCSFT